MISPDLRIITGHTSKQRYVRKSGLFVRRMEEIRKDSGTLRYESMLKENKKATVTVDTVNIHYDSPYNSLNNAYS
jgi:hypothetical protein